MLLTMNFSKEEAHLFLEKLVNQVLLYGLKSPDTELYEFGFGELETGGRLAEGNSELNKYVLHVLCRFKVIGRGQNRQIKIYYEDTPSNEFCSEIQSLIGLKIKRVALSEKNDLWLDFGEYWIVFGTHENGEESWRFFMPNTGKNHLVVSNTWATFDK